MKVKIFMLAEPSRLRQLMVGHHLTVNRPKKGERRRKAAVSVHVSREPGVGGQMSGASPDVNATALHVHLVATVG
jgi:hypothetical protein